MRSRALLILTAIVSAILGALAVYLVLTIPNDLRAGTLLKRARQDLEARQYDRARESLEKIVQQYPRTDAAAAATVALISIGQKDRAEMVKAITLLRIQNEQQTRAISLLQRGVVEVRAEAAKAAVAAAARPQTTATVGPMLPAPAKKPVVTKATPKKKPANRPRRR